jgi:hypothetical protein
MKNDPKGLEKILQGKIVVPESGGLYITADIDDPSEFIFIPQEMINGPITDIWLTVKKAKYLDVPNKNDEPVREKCFVLKNTVYNEEHFTWVGNENSGCWAYYPKS